MHHPEDRKFFGHPRGLGYLAFTEAWERFSYYGMQSLLVPYMVNRLQKSDGISYNFRVLSALTRFRGIF